LVITIAIANDGYEFLSSLSSSSSSRGQGGLGGGGRRGGGGVPESQGPGARGGWVVDLQALFSGGQERAFAGWVVVAGPGPAPRSVLASCPPPHPLRAARCVLAIAAPVLADDLFAALETDVQE
jgi:hypothetical protein